jgi:hypothetical protein
MTCYSYLIFLIALSGLSLITVLVLHVLDLAHVDSKQKITILKINIIMLGLAPFIFTFLQLLSWRALEIISYDKFINQLPVPILLIPFTEQKIYWSFYIVIAYSLGVFMMILRILYSYLNAKKLLSDSIPAIIQGQSVFINEHIKSPFNFGLPTAKIYVPSNFESKWTSREIQMSLSHEKNHLKQNDSLWKFLSLVIQAILFFLPWSYLLHRRFELEIEIVCDEKTCSATTASIKEYGNLLLAMTCVQSKHFIFTNITDSTLKRRFLAMKSNKLKRPFLISICCAVLLLAGSATIAMTSGLAAKKSIFDIISKIYVDGELVSSPHIIARANQIALVVISDHIKTQDNKILTANNSLRLGLIATDVTTTGKNNEIKISYDIEYLNGENKMHSKPKIILTPNQEGAIRISDAGHVYEVRVLAKRQ